MMAGGLHGPWLILPELRKPVFCVGFQIVPVQRAQQDAVRHKYNTARNLPRSAPGSAFDSGGLAAWMPIRSTHCGRLSQETEVETSFCSSRLVWGYSSACRVRRHRRPCVPRIDQGVLSHRGV